MQLDLFGSFEAAPQSNCETACDGPEQPQAAAAIPSSPAAAATHDDPMCSVPQTIAEAHGRYAPGISDHPRRAGFRSALGRLGDVLRTPLDRLPTDPKLLRPLLQAAKPAAIGMRPRTWIQTKSLAFAALRALDCEIIGRDPTPLSTSWEALSSQLPFKQAVGLSRYLRYLSRHQISPHAATVTDFTNFRAELHERAPLINLMLACNQAARAWNKASETVPDWPSIKLPIEADSRHYGAAWEDFPEALQFEVQAFLASRANCDVLDDNYAGQVRPATTNNRNKALRLAASCLVLSGRVPMAELTNLRLLCEVENLRAILAAMRDRHPDKRLTQSALNVAWTVRTVAKYWLEDRAATDAIKAMIKKVSGNLVGQRGGMRPRNRERLRQFDVPTNVDALVDLPSNTLKRLLKAEKPSQRECVRLMYALMVGILMFVPIRSKNLVELKLQDHVIDIGKGSHRSVRIHLPAEITKTERDFDAPLPPHLYPVLDVWLTRCRPIVCSASSGLLFPNAQGQLRSRDALANKLTLFLRKETGLVMNLHLFRHLAAKLYLDSNPNGIELVSQLLGHSSSRTTLKAYAELKTDPAFRMLEAAVFKIVDRGPSAGDTNGKGGPKPGRPRR